MGKPEFADVILFPPPPQNVTLDWSEELVDIQPMFPPPPPKYEPWDLSALQSSSSAPFSSLEYCSKHSYTQPHQSLGNAMGYPGVFQSNPCLYPSKPIPMCMGMVLIAIGHGLGITHEHQNPHGIKMQVHIKQDSNTKKKLSDVPTI